MKAQLTPEEKPFQASMDKFFGLIQELQSRQVMQMQLGGLENVLETEGRELLRTMLEEHIHLRGPGQIGTVVTGSDGVERSPQRERSISIKTIFGAISIERLVYGKPSHVSLMPKDALLNLPENKYSHGLEIRLATEVAKGSFDEAIASVKMQTGVTIAKRQAEEIAQNAAQDFQSFYEQRDLSLLQSKTKARELLVLTTDGKGITMRTKDLREKTKQRAKQDKKLKKRLTRGEKKNSKRMAQVASVYSLDRNERTAQEIINPSHRPPPKPEAKRIWASVWKGQDDIISELFNEAQTRDPRYRKQWVILTDGHMTQLSIINQEIRKRQLQATIVFDIIHVIEYLWKASRDFHPEGSIEGEEWVSRYLLQILLGKAKNVASAIRRSATRQSLKKRKGVDSCATYLHNNADYLKYDQYLAEGLPIATGVIEGACRYLIKDRMDITGARWGLKGAEAILKLRSIHASGDWDEYWAFHQSCDYERNHKIHYAHPERLEQPRLRLVT